MAENKFSTSLITYGVVLPVPRPIGRQLQPLRERYAGNNQLLPLHITLIFPFHFAGDRGELQERLRQVSQAIPPFMVEIGDWGYFAEKRVIFLSVALNEALRRLHLRLRESLSLESGEEFRAFEGENYRPHITLAQDLAAEVFPQAWQEFKAHQLFARFRAKEFCLYQALEEAPWEELAVFPLTGAG